MQWVRQSFSAKGARAVWSEPASKPAPKEGKGLDRAGTPAVPKAAAVEQKFPNGAFVIDLAQPGSRIARALIEEDRSVDSAFARAELAKYERNVHRRPLYLHRRLPGELRSKQHLHQLDWRFRLQPGSRYSVPG